MRYVSIELKCAKCNHSQMHKIHLEKFICSVCGHKSTMNKILGKDGKDHSPRGKQNGKTNI